jgi:hypothetical protein
MPHWRLTESFELLLRDWILRPGQRSSRFGWRPADLVALRVILFTPRSDRLAGPPIRHPILKSTRKPNRTSPDLGQYSGRSIFNPPPARNRHHIKAPPTGFGYLGISASGQSFSDLT